MKLSATDHEGGGWIQLFQVKGGKLVKASEWFQSYPEVIKKHLEAEAKKS